MDLVFLAREDYLHRLFIFIRIKVFPRRFRHGGICPSPYGRRDKCRGQSVNRGTREGGMDIMG